MPLNRIEIGQRIFIHFNNIHFKLVEFVEQCSVESTNLSSGMILATKWILLSKKSSSDNSGTNFETLIGVRICKRLEMFGNGECGSIITRMIKCWSSGSECILVSLVPAIVATGH